jgi:TctA family transporter
MAGTPAIFFERPISLGLVIAAVLVLVFTILLRRRSRTMSELMKGSASEV